MEVATAEVTESASRTSDSGNGDREPQLTGLTYVNATPSGEVQLRVMAEPVMNLGGERTADESDIQESSGQSRTMERGLLHTNQTHGVHLGASNEQAFMYSASMQSQVQMQAGMKALGMDKRCSSQMPHDRGRDDAYSGPVSCAYTVDQGFGAPGNQMRGRRDVPEVGYDSVAETRYPGSSNGPRYRKPATYDGTTEWRDYLVQFEMVAELNRWDERTKALELATNLRGTAQGVLSDLRPEYRVNYKHLVLALQSRFEPKNQEELYRAQIKSRIRKKGEALTELAQDIKRLIRLAYPEGWSEIRERLARDSFIDSLNDAELEWAVFRGKPITVDDAVRLGLEYEAFEAGHGKRTLH
jgi:hypothetical protein